MIENSDSIFKILPCRLLKCDSWIGIVVIQCISQVVLVGKSQLEEILHLPTICKANL